MTIWTWTRWLRILLFVLVPVAAWAAGAEGPGAVSGDEAVLQRMTILAIQVGLLLFLAKLGNALFERLRLPGALGELICGILVGPYALGSLHIPGLGHGLFPPVELAVEGTLTEVAVSPELSGLATLASIVLLFKIGLETDLRLLMRYALAGSLAGMGGMIASFLVGAGTVALFADRLEGIAPGLFSPAALMLGTITTATSVGISARILSEKRQLDSPEGVTILSAAVIDDVLGIILLAVVMSLLSLSGQGGGIEWGRIGLVALKAIGVWLGATIAGIALSRRISLLLKAFGDRTSIAVLALGLAMVLAGLFERVHLAMIIGAYVMGVSLSQTDLRHVIEEKLRAIYILLVPLFFCVTGMRIDLGALADPGILLFGLVYAALALTAKVLGCGLPAMLGGFTLRGAARIGFGMAPRCEVALIVAGAGLAKGFVPNQVLAAVIIMIIVNTVIAPPVLVALFRRPVRGTRKEMPIQGNSVDLPFDFPSDEMATFLGDILERLFASEGYYTHAIDHHRRLFQFRKDDSVVDFRQDGSRLVFTCRRDEEALVNAVMLEALAELEHTLVELRKPLDAANIQERMQRSVVTGQCIFRMENHLIPELIEPELSATDKAGAIDELLELLDGQGLLRDRAAARRAVLEREESLSTGLQFGVAIPHGRSDAVDTLVCAIGRNRKGIDFDALDDEPSHIFVLTLSPATKPAPHLQFMSAVSQTLNEEGRRRVREARNAREIFRVFCGPVPVPRRAPGPEAPAALPPPRRSFLPENYLREELVLVDLVAADKQSAIAELIDLLAQQGRIDDRDEALRVVLDREEQNPTGLEEGLALPHGRTTAAVGLSCAIGIARAGIDFGARDGKPARIILLILTPTDGEDPYLQFVAWAMSALDAAGRKAVLAAGSPAAVVTALSGNGRAADGNG